MNDKISIRNEIHKFCRNLYKSTIPQPQSKSRNILNVCSEKLSLITISELKHALKQMKNGKSPGDDHITTKMLKLCGTDLMNAIKMILNKFLVEW